MVRDSKHACTTSLFLVPRSQVPLNPWQHNHGPTHNHRPTCSNVLVRRSTGHVAAHQQPFCPTGPYVVEELPGPVHWDVLQGVTTEHQLVTNRQRLC